VKHPAALRLNHKDERQRRRAVRKLFEINDSDNLESFTPLLEDGDPWFREKAMQAAVKWLGRDDIKVVEKLSNSTYNEQRVLASKLANRINEGRDSILEYLCQDEDISVRLSGWESRLSVGGNEVIDIITSGMDSEHKAIRKSAVVRLSKMENINESLVINALEDTAYSVRNAGLIIIRDNIEMNEHRVFDEYLINIVRDSTNIGRNIAVSILVKTSWESVNIREMILKWSEEEDIEFINSFVKALKEIAWWKIPNFGNHIKNKSSDLFLTRILRKDQTDLASSIRNQIIQESRRGEVVVARIIEDLIGRNIDQDTLESIKKVSESDNKLLSTISKQLLKDLQD
tara:strand:+ start:591 stop:1622 length:1032 start_codon:yes stop_codon:yes gene_type:complete